MDLADRVAELAVRADRQRDQMVTEEAAKHALVLPLLQALGYDVFNPLEVRPEFTADIGTKKGEKVDYALEFGGSTQVLIECKPIGSKLELNHASQLFRYFSVTAAKFGVLTDGVRYCFYTDLDAPNRMDGLPFFIFDIASHRESEVEHLKKFARENFDVDAITRTASDMKYLRALRTELERELTTPSDEFVKLLGKRVYSSSFTTSVVTKFADLLRRAAAAHIREKVDGRLRNALHTTSFETEENVGLDEANEDENTTTDLEIDGFKTVQAIGAEHVDPADIHMRDQKSYCSILYANNNRKPIVRLWFNNEKRLAVEFFDGDGSEKIRIGRTLEIYQYKDRIRRVLSEYADLQSPKAAMVSNGVEAKPAFGDSQAGNTDSL